MRWNRLLVAVCPMYLENIVFDAVEPRRLGRFWEAALGCERLTDADGGYETRLTIEAGPVLDLCFQRVPDPALSEPRLHLDLRGGADQAAEAARLLGLGARHLDIGQGDVPWAVIADPEGNPFCVLQDWGLHGDTGPIAALPLDSGDPDRDAEFWSWLTGWTPVQGESRSLSHPSRKGPILELCPEPAPKGSAKNRIYLDIRLEPGDRPDAVGAGIAERGGDEIHSDRGELPWRIYADPSGNEFCLLPARS